MMRKIRERQGEEGFTLIELLVVVIIIGILAAIAIPVFLNQRQNALERALEASVSNAVATAQTAAIEDGNLTRAETEVTANATAAHTLSFVAGTASLDFCVEAVPLNATTPVRSQTVTSGQLSNVVASTCPATIP